MEGKGGSGIGRGMAAWASRGKEGDGERRRKGMMVDMMRSR